MTNLDAHTLVAKTHPRIIYRGKLDSLQSELILAMTELPADLLPALNDALSLLRLLMRADVTGEALPAWFLGGMDAEQVHDCSWHPERYGFPGHIVPAPEQGRTAALLNVLRAHTRETELAAAAAYGDAHGDCLLALNRLSSFLYVLQLRAAGEYRC